MYGRLWYSNLDSSIQIALFLGGNLIVKVSIRFFTIGLCWSLTVVNSISWSCRRLCAVLDPRDRFPDGSYVSYSLNFAVVQYPIVFGLDGYQYLSTDLVAVDPKTSPDSVLSAIFVRWVPYQCFNITSSYSTVVDASPGTVPLIVERFLCRWMNNFIINIGCMIERIAQ